MPVLWNEIKTGFNSSLRCVLACWQNVSYSIEYVGNFMRVRLNLLATFSFLCGSLACWRNFPCSIDFVGKPLLLLLLFKIICYRLFRVLCLLLKCVFYSTRLLAESLFFC